MHFESVTHKYRICRIYEGKNSLELLFNKNLNITLNKGLQIQG